MKNKDVIVHVKNEQEWDVIKKECSSSSSMYIAPWEDRRYKDQDVGIWITGNSYCNLRYFRDTHPVIPIISFEEYQTGYIVGKWYKFSALGDNYYAKLYNISDRKISSGNKGFDFNESISDGEYRIKKDWWALSLKPTLLTYLSEIQEFLPNGHEDKEVTVEYKFPEKWQVGTYGVVITSTHSLHKVGSIDKIKEGTKGFVWFERFSSYKPDDLFYSMGLEFKWFATLGEAEAFSKTLTKEEVKELTELTNGVYLHISYSDSPITYIVIGHGGLNSRQCVSLKSLDFNEENSFSSRGIQIRLATQEEIDWLDACIRADEYVENPRDVVLGFAGTRRNICLDHTKMVGVMAQLCMSDAPSMSVKIRNKKPETQTVSKRVKLNFQINQSKLTIKLRNSHGSN